MTDIITVIIEDRNTSNNTTPIILTLVNQKGSSIEEIMLGITDEEMNMNLDPNLIPWIEHAFVTMLLTQGTKEFVTCLPYDVPQSDIDKFIERIPSNVNPVHLKFYQQMKNNLTSIHKEAN